MENSDMPTFPTKDPDTEVAWHGLTKREYFAGQIMAQLLNADGMPRLERASSFAIRAADALLLALEAES